MPSPPSAATRWQERALAERRALQELWGEPSAERANGRKNPLKRVEIPGDIYIIPVLLEVKCFDFFKGYTFRCWFVHVCSSI